MRFTAYLFLLTASSLMATADIQAQNEELISQEALSIESEGFLDKECGKDRKRPKFRFPDRPTPTVNPGMIEGQTVVSKESTISFSMSVSVPPSEDFAFYQGNGQPNQFDPSSTNPSQPSYTSTFLVPSDGTIANLNIRVDVTAGASINPSFLFTVYSAESTIGSIAPISNWTATALSQGTGAFSINSGDSVTGTFQNLETRVNVAAGTLLTVVITPEGYNRYDVQPATFSASFTYTPSAAR